MSIRAHSVSIYASGKMIFKNATKKEAAKAADEMIPLLENEGAFVED
jgi:hypothetical protein